MPRKGQVVGQSTTTEAGGRQYARRRFPLLAVCAECEVAPATERHHWDGDPTNNVRNVVPLCHRCHLRIDGRLDAARGRIRRLQATTVALKLARTHCKHGHEYTPENTYYPLHGGRACRLCTNEAQRRYQRRKRNA
jgi:hypothetical protein